MIALSVPVKVLLRRHFSGRLEGMRASRMSFWAHWAQLAQVYLPRRYKWFVTPNQWARGSQMNAQILDETGVLCARILSNGMMAGLTSPTRPWFKLTLHSLQVAEYGPVKEWLADCERRLTRVLSQSNFYESLGTLYLDNGVFGSAAMVEYEDPREVVRFYNPCLGEFFFGSSSRLDVDSLYREFTLTVTQVVEQFGLANCSDSVKQLFQAGGASWQQEVIIQHGIEPNTELFDGEASQGYPVPKKFPYRELYWEVSSQEGRLLDARGFNEKPFVGARWDIVSNDDYGRSPGMDGMPAVRQLQVQQMRLGQAIDKLVNPPMVASVSMRNEPMSTLPGTVSYVADVSAAGFKPAYQVDPRIQEMNMNIEQTQARAKSIFFVDLFMMISELDTVRTATEIDARREEKLVQLGPVIERFENEVLDPIIERTFAIMQRRGLFLPPPDEIVDEEVSVQYVSMLAEAQRAASTTAIERVYAFAGNMAAVQPEILDNLDSDAAIKVYADSLSVAPQVVRATKSVLAIRKQRAEQAAQQQAMAATAEAVQGAKVLSDTDVGGGQSALSAMMN